MSNFTVYYKFGTDDVLKITFTGESESEINFNSDNIEILRMRKNKKIKKGTAAILLYLIIPPQLREWVNFMEVPDNVIRVINPASRYDTIRKFLEPHRDWLKTQSKKGACFYPKAALFGRITEDEAYRIIEDTSTSEVINYSTSSPENIAHVPAEGTDLSIPAAITHVSLSPNVTNGNASDAYESTSQQSEGARITPIGGVDLSISTACRLISTNIQTSSIFIEDEKRRQLYTDIDNAFSQGHNAVFLCGFGGLGKSEFARQYAVARTEDRTYHTVVFAPIDVKRGNVNLQTLICDDVVFSITNFPKRNEISFFDGRGSIERKSESVDEYFARKLARIKELCDQKTLIIIDNFDVAYDSEIRRFLEGNYRVIITTRYKFPNINCPQIEIEPMNHEMLAKMFFEYSGRTDITQNDPALFETFDLLGLHTMAIEILAKYMAAEQIITIDEVLDKLRQRGSLANFDEAIQISSESEEMRPFEYIAALFDVTSLLEDKNSAEDFKTILAGMSLMPLSGVNKIEFLGWCKIKSTSAINKLIQRSWISESKRDGLAWISMHPVVAEVMRDRLKPNFTSCDKLTDSLVSIANNSYHLDLKTASYTSTVIKRMIYLCSTYDISEHKILISFAGFFSTIGEFEEAKLILDMLLQTATIINQGNPIILANIYSQFATYYSGIRDYRNAISIRNESISLYEQCEGEQEKIKELQLTNAWNYIYYKDIPTALTYTETINDWLKHEPPGTKQYARYLHILARLDYETGNYKSAINRETEALRIFETIQVDNMDCGSIYCVLGLCNVKHQSTFELGIQQLKRCLDIWSRYRTPQQNNIIDIHYFIADAYFENGRLSEALFWYQRCLSSVNSIENQALSLGLTSIRKTLERRIEECEMASNG